MAMNALVGYINADINHDIDRSLLSYSVWYIYDWKIRLYPFSLFCIVQDLGHYLRANLGSERWFKDATR